MIKNHLKILFRSIVRQQFYASINIIGLTIGIATSLLISMYIVDELSYDKFHADAEDIFRVDLNGRLGEQEFNSCYTSAPAAEGFLLDIPEISSSTRIAFWDDVNIENGEESFTEKKLLLADSNFFSFFSFRLLEGTASGVLNGPNKVVLTKSTAKKLFQFNDQSYESLMGKMILIGNDNRNCIISGIAEDPPENAHFHYNVILSMDSYMESRSPSWISNNLITYVKKSPVATQSQIESKFPEIVKKYVGPQVQMALGITIDDFFKQGGKYGFYLEPITGIHLNPVVDHDIEPGGNMNSIYLLSTIAAFILIIACINFMNLSTARFANRAKEVGVRKSLGASRKIIALQFLGESVLYSFIALVIALCILIPVLPSFNALADKSLTLSMILNVRFIGILLALIMVVGLAAGSYPALFLTAFKPTEVLRGQVRAGIKSGGLRSSLVVFQFIISSGLIILTILIFKQLNHLQALNLGFDKENLMVINNINALGPNKNAFKKELVNSHHVINASISYTAPPEVKYSDVFRPLNGQQQDYGFNYNIVDYDHFETFGIPLLKGRYFSKTHPSDSNAVIINEAAARMMGWENPVGEKIQTHQQGNPVKEIIGVVKDFNFISLQDDITALAIFPGDQGNLLAVRLSKGDVYEKVKYLESTWNTFSASVPFDYSFIDVDFDAKFKKERQLGRLFILFTILSIIVATLGLIGLATFTTQQRAKEIGIRKVLGSTSLKIIVLLSKEYLKLIGFSYCIAVPLTYWIITWWLENFAYKMAIGFASFLFGGLFTIVIALLAVGYQSLKAALANPVDSINYE